MSQYETKDSGERATFEGGGERDTESGKPRFDLTEPVGVPWARRLSVRFAMLMGRGADKYGDRNWETFRTEKALRRARSSAYRHFMQWYHGDDAPEEDHAAAVMFNILATETIRWKMEQAITEVEGSETIGGRVEMSDGSSRRVEYAYNVQTGLHDRMLREWF